MLKKFVSTKLLDNLDFQPTESQEELIGEISEFITTGNQQEIMLIRGYAGTGKTTIVNSIVRTLKETGARSVLLAPTGRAAKVMFAYTGHTAWTIHKKIYRQKSGSDGLGSFVLDRNMHKNTYFIIDEASMIGQSASESIFGTGNLLSDLLQYVEGGVQCRLILIGDTAQLPPVRLEVSPALDKKVLQSFGYTVRDYTLTDIVRHQQDSGILVNATAIRDHITTENISIPGLSLNGYADVQRIGGADLLEAISNSYDKYGDEDTIIVTRSNKRANRFNAGVRGQILWREEKISRGDLLMVVKNNYFWKDEEQRIDFIANGDIGRIERVIGFEEIYGMKYADVEMTLIDYNDVVIEAKILLDVLEVEGPSLPVDIQRELYNTILEDYPDLTSKKKRMEHMQQDRYFNALQVKFAYSVTCHKAQGGQWKSVFLDLGYFTDDMITLDYLRWLYTAFTRATEKMYLVNFPDRFFE
ncbi:MAG: AAA family ATPase [Bacteroidales bacterium]|nr:AAA family ATPase [Bacteroidales bacterium]MDT8430078.1 AAA family ATPase [Bacteroidales bacterium]